MDRIERLSRKETNGCWRWLGTKDKENPVIHLKSPRRLYSARRYAYETWNQVTVPKDWVVTQTCKEMVCVNPAHLTACKRGQHAWKKWGLKKPDYCQRGHEFSLWNTGEQKNGGRLCLACDRNNRRINATKWRRERPEHAREIRVARQDRKRAWVRSFKAICVRCGETDSSCLDFHHRDPSEKDTSIAAAMVGWSQTRLEVELAKCDVLCSNCHRKLHASERVVTEDTVTRPSA